jgi:hypothetical protein
VRVWLVACCGVVTKLRRELTANDDAREWLQQRQDDDRLNDSGYERHGGMAAEMRMARDERTTARRRREKQERAMDVGWRRTSDDGETVWEVRLEGASENEVTEMTADEARRRWRWW